jgi:coenzyme F420-reducing hydrogenase delta subunit
MGDSKHKPDHQKILVFSTNSISDPGIDLAGAGHLHYASSVKVIPLPCSSGVRPDWIVHALEAGFDGVFIAACGGDCSYLQDCTGRTGKLVSRAQALLKEKGLNPKRVKMSAICSVCAEPFVNHMENFEKELEKIAEP